MRQDARHVVVAQRIVLAHTPIEVFVMEDSEAVQRACAICMTPVPCDALQAARMLLRLEAAATSASQQSSDWWLAIWLELEAAGPGAG